LLALIVPGIVLSLRFALIDAVVVLEGVEGGSARNLSAKLTQGKRWDILGTIILTFVAVVIAIFLTSFMLELPLALAGINENFIIAVIQECISNVVLLLPIIVWFLFYWEAKNQLTSDRQEDNQQL
jgi:hypothetical protein